MIEAPAHLAVGETIRSGHRHLLDTYRELAVDLEEADADASAEDLLAAVAFLRQSLLPFARWEESCLEPASEHAENTAFEHAFLAAEIESLAAAVESLLHAPQAPVREEAARRLRRCAHRLEAVLELHVLKAEERESLGLDPSEAIPDAGAGEPRAMGREELMRLVRRHDWALLSTYGEEHPYAVPVAFGFDGHAFYFASGPGRKLRYLQSNPSVCLTIAEVRDGSRWRTVVVRGEVEWVEELAGRAAALRALRRQRKDTFSPRDVARLARARIARLVPTEISGRVRG